MHIVGRVIGQSCRAHNERCGIGSVLGAGRNDMRAIQERRSPAPILISILATVPFSTFDTNAVTSRSLIDGLPARGYTVWAIRRQRGDTKLSIHSIPAAQCINAKMRHLDFAAASFVP